MQIVLHTIFRYKLLLKNVLVIARVTKYTICRENIRQDPDNLSNCNVTFSSINETNLRNLTPP